MNRLVLCSYYALLARWSYMVSFICEQYNVAHVCVWRGDRNVRREDVNFTLNRKILLGRWAIATIVCVCACVWIVAWSIKICKKEKEKKKKLHLWNSWIHIFTTTLLVLISNIFDILIVVWTINGGGKILLCKMCMKRYVLPKANALSSLHFPVSGWKAYRQRRCRNNPPPSIWKHNVCIRNATCGRYGIRLSLIFVLINNKRSIP